MTKFVEENDDCQHEQEGDDVADEPMAQHIETMQKKLGHPIPLNQGRRPCPQPTRMPLRQFEARGGQPDLAHYGQRQWRRPPRSMARGFPSESSRSAWPRPAARSRRI